MKCLHKVFVRGSGLCRDGLTCEKCGYSKYPECFGFWSRVKFYLGISKIRELNPGELFHSDGVYQKPVGAKI